jgi:N-sulfoglucosamine sulfohydrolase
MKPPIKKHLLSISLAIYPLFGLLAEAKPLNVLIITTDDQGKEVGAYGDDLAITPNLDQLAAEGVLFERAYIPAATCSPSRAALLTGLYPHQNGHIGLAGHHPEYRVREGVVTLPALLKEAGFRTGIIGKLHVAPYRLFPFDFEWAKSGNPARTRDVREVARQAGQFLTERDGAPFFLYVNYFDPHRPFDADANQYKGLPQNPYGPDDIVPLTYLGMDSPELRRETAIYYNAIKRMDIGLGMLFDELRKAGVYDQTLIIFLSDHGAPFTRAKTTAYEAGEAVPFILKWPTVSVPGLRQEAFISSVDIMPTVLDALGLDIPPVPGRSLRPAVEGRIPADWPGYAYGAYNSHSSSHFYPRRSIRNAEFKLIHNLLSPRPNPVPAIGAAHPSTGADVFANEVMRQAFETSARPPEWELYDLTNDPHETVNLALKPEKKQVLQEFQKKLHAWRQGTEDPLLDPIELQRLLDAHGM